MTSFNEWAGDTTFRRLVLAVLVLVGVALAAYTYLTIKEAKYVYSGPTVISVRGVAEVTQVPDIATFTFSVNAEAETPAAAQEQSAEAVNAILAYLAEEGVAEGDIKTTGYNLSPRYEYRQEPCVAGACPPGRQILTGYTAFQTVEVRVRDTEVAGGLIAGVGERGATNVSSLHFTAEDDAAAKADARAQAVADAKQKAEQLAETLGVRLVRLTGYWEEEGNYPMYYGRGGDGMEMMASSMAPDLPVGENTVTSVVNLSYEIR